jgi:hypothetical protein
MTTTTTDRHRAPRSVRAGLAAALLLASCGSDEPAATSGSSPAGVSSSGVSAPNTTAPVIDPGDGGDDRPPLDPANVVDAIDNPYLPLRPGTRWVYEGETDEGTERIEVEVTSDHHTVMGIDATVVRDTAYLDGEMIEDTLDWFAQDADGNVWYLGEQTAEYEDGEVVSTDGSWEAGVGGALPGIVMPADPTVGDAYRQEHLAGEAEDMGEVIRTGGTVEVPAGSYADVVVTRDWTPLEPDVIEEKSYAPGVGLVVEVTPRTGETVALVEHTPAP